MTSTYQMSDLRARLQLALGAGYEVGAEIGKGGMSRVFAARDVKLRRDIVVKTLPPELAGDISLERFTREIHIAASLQHPHIVPVHAAGDVDGLPYYTMPRVDGESLRERLIRVQRLPLTEVLTTMRDVGRALAYAHRRGLVHRDIKPENILIAEGMALVTDFGIAKAVAAARVEETPTPSLNQTGTDGATLTATGTYLGTPNYVAPEQMMAETPIDHRADLFAFGVVAYELLCGVIPYAARGAAVRYATRPRDVAVQRLDVPPVIAQLVMQCLEIDPAARPASADEIVKKLDAATSATPLAPVGDDPSVTRKAFGWYAVAFVAATGLAWIAMIGLGLPDWVLPGTMIVMALGLPVVTTAALTRRAAFQSSLERATQLSRIGWLVTPGPLTMRVAQALTWRRILIGGGSSLGGFAVLVAGFMASRSSGVGPGATLLTSGQVRQHQSILLTEFTAAPQDSSLARVAAEAVSIALRESNVVQVVPPESVGDALRRMRRDPAAPVTLEVARQLATREGISLIASGSVARDRERIVIGVRLIAADSGTVLTTQQASASETTDIVDAADRLARSLRSRIGESLKRLRAAPPLARATTVSIEALDLYTQALRASDYEADNLKAKGLLERALQLDSTFAIAWRKYYLVEREEPAKRNALKAAFRHRHNASEPERLEIEGQYYWSHIYDRPRSIAAYEALARRSGVPVNNHAWFLIVLRQFARSESLYRAIFLNSPDGTGYNPYHGLFWALMNQGKHAAADSAARVARARFPDVLPVRFWTTTLKCGMRQFDACEAGLDSILTINPRHQNAIRALSELALMRGELGRWELLARQLAGLQEPPPPTTYCCPVRIVRPTAAGSQIRQALHLQALVERRIVRLPPEIVRARLDSVTNQTSASRARGYAQIGQLDSARAIVSRLETLVPDTTGEDLQIMNAYLGAVGQGGWTLTQAKAAIALAQGRTRDGIALYRASDVHPADGMPVYPCGACATLDLAEAFDLASESDSAIVFYERFLSATHYIPTQGAPWASRASALFWDLVNKAWIHERLGALYEATGNREMAVAHLTSFAELWKEADPQLQPRVAAARARIALLKVS